MGRSDPPESQRDSWTQSILPVAAGLGHGRSAHSREPATLMSAIRQLRERRRRRRLESQERRVAARENLRDFKRFTGDEPGPSGGGL
jgi:hypothetical protein